ncbi:MAG: UbiA family prenyltransferase [Candidatus Heimdallarchaeaceae archaeon]
MLYLGYLSSSGSLFDLKILTLLFCFAISTGAIYNFNNAFDYRVDRHNKIKRINNPVSLNHITKEDAIIFGIFLSSSCLIISYFLNFLTFAILFSIIIWGCVYSFRLKGIPILDVLTHAIFWGSLLAFLGSSINGKFTGQTMYFATIFFIISCLMQLSNHIRDYRDDKKEKIRTTVVFLGLKKSKILFELLIIFYFISLLYVYFVKTLPLAYFLFFIIYMIVHIIEWKKSLKLDLDFKDTILLE